jgi:hypothetical protein
MSAVNVEYVASASRDHLGPRGVAVETHELVVVAGSYGPRDVVGTVVEAEGRAGRGGGGGLGEALRGVDVLARARVRCLGTRRREREAGQDSRQRRGEQYDGKTAKHDPDPLLRVMRLQSTLAHASGPSDIYVTTLIPVWLRLHEQELYQERPEKSKQRHI